MTTANNNVQFQPYINELSSDLSAVVARHIPRIVMSVTNSIKRSIESGLQGVAALPLPTTTTTSRKRKSARSRAARVPTTPADLRGKVLVACSEPLTKASIYSAVGGNRAKIDKEVLVLTRDRALRQTGHGRMTAYQTVPGHTATHAVN